MGSAKPDLRLAAYLAAALTLLAIGSFVPGTWAASSQRGLGQTVPTRTPTRPFVLTVAPTEAPTEAPTQAPPPAPTVPPPAATATAAPDATVVPTATTEQARPVLALALEADRTAVWPGLTIAFTLTLSNRGNASARQVALEMALPEGLQLVEARGGDQAWQGNTLRVTSPVLAPGGRLAASFTARVASSGAPGGVIICQAAASAANATRATAGLALVLPPAELPPTGREAGLSPARD